MIDSNISSIGLIGATSPLGIYLVELLIKYKYKVYAGYKNKTLIPLFWWENKFIIPIRADIQEQKSLISAFSKCDIIIWLAHCRQGKFNEGEIELNVRPFKWFCANLAAFNIKKLIFISSGGSVYGEAITLPISEEHPRTPLSAYGKAKKHIEDILLLYAKKRGIDTVILRPGNIYGFDPLGKIGKGIIKAFFQSLHFKKTFTLLGEGKTIRDYVHIIDVTKAILYAIESKQEHILWNVSTNTGYSVNDILKLITKTMNYKEPNIIRKPSYNTDVNVNILSNEKMLLECGWIPQITIEEGIKEMVKIYNI